VAGEPNRSTAVFTDNERECDELKHNVKGNPCGHSSVDIERVRYSFPSDTYTNIRVYTLANFDTSIKPHNDKHTDLNTYSHAYANAARGTFD